MKYKSLNIDFETYSSVDITKCGHYVYTQSIDFEILIIAYSINRQPVKSVDLLSGENMPAEFIEALNDPDCKIYAHNAAFERQCLIAYGFDIPIERFYCSAVKAAYCGLPMSLAELSKALNLGQDKAKMAEGKALIRLFSLPRKPTKNNPATRVYPEDEPEKWKVYIEYCVRDVEAEMEVSQILSKYELPETERLNYILDQQINDRGLKVDYLMAQKAVEINEQHSIYLKNEMQRISGLDNPNSVAQITQWLASKYGIVVESLDKESVKQLLSEVEDKPELVQFLKFRQQASKSSVKKYTTMMSCAGYDDRVRGLFQFYGAGRTGRWAGRLVQLQNLTKNKFDESEDLAQIRDLLKYKSYKEIFEKYPNVPDFLSQLVRLTFVAKPNHTFLVADFSAIEARVIAWLAGEQWRLDVFNGDGKIYETSASKMFSIPLDQITPDLRQKGKVAELALGYQGGVGAMIAMGADKMGLSDDDMKDIVARWRLASPAIVKLWNALDTAIKHVCRTKRTHVLKGYKGIEISHNGHAMLIKLPNGRSLIYHAAQLAVTETMYGPREQVRYMWVNGETKKWEWCTTYGGKITENIVQAISRDLLADNMRKLDAEGFEIVMHVHDEVVVEDDNENNLEIICSLMGAEIEWAKGLPLAAAGYHTPFYKKD